MKALLDLARLFGPIFLAAAVVGGWHPFFMVLGVCMVCAPETTTPGDREVLARSRRYL